MSVTVRHIADFLESLAPASLKLSYDNVGLQVGIYESKVSGILTTLDVTEAVIDEAISKNVNLIIAHHPIIFPSISSITNSTQTGQLIYKLIQNNISLLVSHTNLDSIKGGVSYVLAEKLGLEAIDILSETDTDLSIAIITINQTQKDQLDIIFQVFAQEIHSKVSSQNKEVDQIEIVCDTLLIPKLRKTLLEKQIKLDFVYPIQKKSPNYGLGAVGQLPNDGLNAEEFLDWVSKKAKVSGFRYSGTKQIIKRVAVCGGSGGSLIKKAIQKKADAYITADIKYHDYFLADNQLLLLDIGHYETEHDISYVLKDKLEAMFSEVPIYVTSQDTNPMQIYFADNNSNKQILIKQNNTKN